MIEGYRLVLPVLHNLVLGKCNTFSTLPAIRVKARTQEKKKNNNLFHDFVFLKDKVMEKHLAYLPGGHIN